MFLGDLLHFSQRYTAERIKGEKCIKISSKMLWYHTNVRDGIIELSSVNDEKSKQIPQMGVTHFWL